MRWDLADFYKQAWRLTVTYKKLWILGLAVAIFSASGNPSGQGSSSSKTPSPSPTATASATIVPPELPLPFLNDVTPTQLEEAGSLFGYRLASNLTGLRTVPLSIYVLAGAEILLLGMIVILIAVAASAWSRAALIHGIGQAEAAGQVDLTLAGNQGRRSLRAFIAIDFLPWLKPLLILFFGGIASAVLAIMQVSVIIPVIIIAALIYLVVIVVHIVSAQVYAYRYTALYSDQYPTAMERGRRSAKGNLLSMTVLGFVNSLIDFATTALLLIPLGGASIIAAVTVFLEPSLQNLLTGAGIVLASLILGSPFFIIKAALMQVFRNGAWHFAFKTVKTEPGGT